ncbi:ACP S-malonyltransferase [Paenibacillus chartarius]|uniref:Malonyl CoA-acyl carrier protein transacylase n=1 Tax=Paenibacillus chartarius TaxID=747481 RepID=A0ABV6DNS6_9BACL
MGKIAFVFPGQGAQAVGMGKDVYESNETARRRFEEADEVLGEKLSELIFGGPEDSLRMTANTQPALLATSIAYLEAFRAAGITPDYVAGHSLGEYSALVAAGVLDYADAVRTVRARGRFMEQAVPSGQGAMAAVLGAEREALAGLCAAVSADVGPVEMANVNCPGQIVISGSIEGVQAVSDRIKEIGAKRAKLLEVSGPFHSSLMKPAADMLRETLRGVTLRNAVVPVVANVTARPVTEAETIRSLLVDQVVSPVLWEDTVAWLADAGVDTFIEIGSGTVLAGLIKKTVSGAVIHSINSVAALEAFMAETKV